MFDKGQEIALGANRYRLEEPLPTQGGHACVWLASSAFQEGRFVIKYPNFKKFRHRALEDLIVRARTEAELLQQFTHDATTNHICPLHDNGTVQTTVGDIPVLVLPYLPGKLPDDIKDGEANYSVGDALRWLKQIAIALRYLHEAEHKHLIHRDLKPGNVLLDSMGDIRLIDLGITKPSRQGDGETTSSMLTTQWAAPEQIIPVDQHADGTRLFRVSTSADVYSLGLLAYYLLSQGKAIAYQAHVISRSHTNLGNQYWQEQQQRLKTWEQALTDLACLTEEKRKESDKSQFIAHLKMLVERERETVSPSGTLIGTLSPILPDAEWFANQCWTWLAQMLSPLPAQRPNAQQVIHYLDQALLMLQPKLDTLLVQPVVTQIAMGEPPKFTVKLQGENLPPILDWLQVTLNGSVVTKGLTWKLQSPVDAAALVNDEVLTQLQLPPMQTAGTFELEVIGEIQGQAFCDASCTFSVVQTASQLWQQGNHAGAILLEPRPEWLDALEQQLDGSLDAAYQHLQFLREVQGKYPGQQVLQQRVKAFNQSHQSTPKLPAHPVVSEGPRNERAWVLASFGALLGAGITSVVAFALDPVVPSEPQASPSTPQALLSISTTPDTDKAQLQQQLETVMKERDKLKQKLSELPVVKEPQTKESRPTPASQPVTQLPLMADTKVAALEKAKDILFKEDKAQYSKLPELLNPWVEAKEGEAMMMMGIMYVLGDKGIKRDETKGCGLLKQAKEKNTEKASKAYADLCG